MQHQTKAAASALLLSVLLIACGGGELVECCVLFNPGFVELVEQRWHGRLIQRLIVEHLKLIVFR
ncbi:MAG: hypothetical protein CGU28_10420 [Candidatus Dactylopiibacterium carminicum]|nr:MAG: hypothetical protein CGU28_10420 [Candidatus Dactylopiibacterium carminicum]